jgi:hypothetical protein
MKAIVTTGLVLLWLVNGAAAQDGRWTTFKTAHNDWGRIDHQIDAQSIQQQGQYRTFWTRVWIEDKRQPMMITINEALFALSQQYAVDCTTRRFGSRFIDSNNPADRKTRLAAMRWEPLDKSPALERIVCGTNAATPVR